MDERSYMSCANKGVESLCDPQAIVLLNQFVPAEIKSSEPIEYINVEDWHKEMQAICFKCDNYQSRNNRFIHMPDRRRTE